MAQGQSKGDKHILVLNDNELEAARNGAVLNVKISANSSEQGINFTAVKASLDILEATQPLYEVVQARREKEKK